MQMNPNKPQRPRLMMRGRVAQESRDVTPDLPLLSRVYALSRENAVDKSL